MAVAAANLEVWQAPFNVDGAGSTLGFGENLIEESL